MSKPTVIVPRDDDERPTREPKETSSSSRARRKPDVDVRGPGGDDEATPLKTVFETIASSWRLIVAILALSIISGIGYFYFTPPVFEADGLVEVEDKEKGIAGLEDLSEMMETRSLADTEIEILQSRFLLGTVVDELGLDVSVGPSHFPVIGRAVARWRNGPTPAPALFGRDKYAWGGEKIVVKKLDVAPGALGTFYKITARANDRYDVTSTDGALVASGEVGSPSVPAPGVQNAPTLLITELKARPGTEFGAAKAPRLAAIQALQARLLVAEKGKMTNVIRLSMVGEDPEELSRIIDTAEKAYIRQNVERKSAFAQKQLDFIESQLPEIKAKVESTEAALNDYRTANRSVDVGLETKAALDATAELEKDIMSARMQLDQSKLLFTDDHPTVHSLKSKLARLEGQRAAVDAHFKAMPRTELDSARLLRDVKVANELYVLLLNKSQELKIVKSGTIGNVRILDTASLPYRPRAPKMAETIGFSIVIGLVVGIATAFIRKSFNVGIEDPEALEEQLGLAVYASVPHSDAQKRRSIKRKGMTKTIPVLALADGSDLAIEAVRSMRTGLQFALGGGDTNVVAIGGPSPEIGKSFIAVNLAHVIAETGQRVLIIDADLRRGHLHKYFGGDRGIGLAGAIASKEDPAKAVLETEIPTLHFMPMGDVPKNPSELLASDRYEEIVAWASKNYDVVILDTAPVLAVTDGVLAARAASMTFLVLRSGQHPVREISAALRRYDQSGIDVRGAIMNDVRPKLGSSYSSYGYHYHYDYR